MSSWIDKELKKRQASKPADARTAELPDAAQRMADLWQRLQAANDALPSELRLRLEENHEPKPEPLPLPDSMQPAHFLAWLRAPNGASLGFTGDALRYVWIRRGGRKSRNFWVRLDDERGLRVLRRVGAAHGSTVRHVDYRFNERAIEHIVRCMVTGKRVTLWSVRKRPFWLF